MYDTELFSTALQRIAKVCAANSDWIYNTYASKRCAYVIDPRVV